MVPAVSLNMLRRLVLLRYCLQYMHFFRLTFGRLARMVTSLVFAAVAHPQRSEYTDTF